MNESVKRYCNACSAEVETVEQVLFDGPHYSKHTCKNCGKFVGFGKKPGNEFKRGKNKYSPADIGVSFCQLCLRPIDRLGTRGVLEIHHVEEIQNGGNDVPENIWVICTSCHKLIHHQRTYLNQHLRNSLTLSDFERLLEVDNVPVDTRAVMVRVFKKAEAYNADCRS